jgi:hypothetical protein
MIDSVELTSEEIVMLKACICKKPMIILINWYRHT